MSEFIKRTRVERIEDFLSKLDTEIDVAYLCDAEEVKDYDDVYEAIEDGDGFNIDIMYYGVAMDYLKDNDPSLQESMEIASEFGYDVASLNSELLASLHASREARGDFSELEGDITYFFEQLELWEEAIQETYEKLMSEGADEDDIEDFFEADLYDEDEDDDYNLEEFKKHFNIEE